MSEDDSSSGKILYEYDDGVVCFGPITESQLERYHRLPRHTVLPSDIKLSLSPLDTVEDKSDGNDSINANVTQLDESKEVTFVNITDSSNANITQLDESKEVTFVNITDTSNTNETQLINTIGEEEDGATGISNNISSVFSSPCESKYVPTGKLMNTEVFNRYIRMGSISSDESFTESRNASISDAEAVGSFDDCEKDELTPINSNCNDTSLCGQLSVSNVIEQNISFPNNNVCKLTRFSQQDDNDLSNCSDSVLDICEDSIVPDEYSVTPGKQRLFDLRHAKPSFRAKTLIASAPLMDRIEETPVIPKILSSPLILDDEVTYKSSENKKNWNVSSATNINQNISVNVNQILSDCELESKNIYGESEKRNLCQSECETMDKSLCSENDKYTASECDEENRVDNKNSFMNIGNISTNNSIIENKSINIKTNSFYNNVVDLETSANIVSNNIASPIIQENDFEKKEESSVIEIVHNSNDTSVVDKSSNESLSIKLLQMSDIMELNETNQTKDISNRVKEFDLDMTMNIDENETFEDTFYLKSNEQTDLNVMITPSNSTSKESSPEKNSLDFEQIILKSNDVSLPSCGNIKINESENNQTQVNISIVDQTLLSDESCSITDVISPVRSNLSDILENRTLEEDACNVALSNNFENHDMLSKDITYTNVDVETLSSSNTQNKFECITNKIPSFSEVNPSMPNEIDGEKEINSNDNLINNSINYSRLTSVDNIYNITSDKINNSARCINNSILSDGLIKTKSGALTEIENQSDNETTEPTLSFENIEEMLLNPSTHSTNNSYQIPRQKNSTDNSNFIAIKLLSETEKFSDEKQCVLFNNDVEQHVLVNNDVNEQSLLEASENILESNNDKEQHVLVNNDVKEHSLSEVSENILESNNDIEQHALVNNDVNEQSLLEASETILESNNDKEQHVLVNNDVKEYSLLEASENILESNNDKEQHVLVNNDVNEHSLLEVSENILESNNDIEQHALVNNDVNEQSLLEASENILESNYDKEQHASTNNDVEERNLLEVSENILESNNEIQDVIQFSENKRVQYENNSPKTQKLVDFSIVQQTPIIASQSKKQKVLNFNNDVNEQSLLEASENILESNYDKEQHASTNNDVEERNLLEVSENILESNNEIQDVIQFSENKRVQYENNSPKTQKLVDFSIVQQTPIIASQSKKQKVLNFSIVDQTPTSKSMLLTSSNNDSIKKDALIDFSTVYHMGHLEVSFNEDGSKVLQNNSKESFLNLSTITNPNVEMLSDVSLKTESSSSTSSNNDSIKKDALIDFSTVYHMGHLEVSFNEDGSKVLQNNSKESFLNLSTITNPDVEMLSDVSLKTESSSSTNLTMIHTTINNDLNLSSNACNVYSTEINSDCYNKETIIDVESVEGCKDEHFNSLNKTIELNKYVNQSSKTEFLPNNSLYQKSEEVEATESNLDSNQQVINIFNNYVIVDFSINEQHGLQNSELKTNKNIIEIESNKQVSHSLENSVMDVTSMNNSDNSIQISDDKSIATQFEKSKLLCDTKFLTNIQMDDMSLLTDSSVRSSINESFHSIESENIQRDNKRKIEPAQECNMNVKKMKMETEIPKTPISMLPKISMFKSNEKSSNYVSNTKENDVRSLNLSKFEDKMNPPKSLKKPVTVPKSKIPCILTNKSMFNNDECNSSSSSDGSIKPKRVIPKYTGHHVLSDLSNSSSKKYPESHIPSKFHK